MSNLEYGGYDVEAAEQEEEDLSKAGSSNYMKLKEGSNVVRILPPPVGRRSPFYSTYQHFINYPGAGPVVFNCPRMMLREDCPACRKADAMRSSASKVDQKAASDFWASRRIYVNVIDRSDEESGPKILGIGKTIHEALIKIRKADPDEGDFTHPEDGFDLDIVRKGSGKNDTSYSVVPSRRSSPLGDMDWIAEQPDLKDKLRVPNTEEILQMFADRKAQATSDGAVGGNVVGDAEGKALPPRRSRRSTTTAQDDIEVNRAGGFDSDMSDIPF